ncbi:MAG: prolipoprotein diacylglyceryl transferase family protein, partial [bacterium]
IPVDIANRVNGFQTFEYFHPTFLYESLWCAVVGIFLIGLHFYRIKKIPANTEIKNIASGNIFFSYLFLYSLGRVCFEFLRIDEVPMIFGVRITQIVAGLVMVMTGAAIIELIYTDKKRIFTEH